VSSEQRQNFVTESTAGLTSSREVRPVPRVEFQTHSSDVLGRKTARSDDCTLPKETSATLNGAVCTSFEDRLVPSLQVGKFDDDPINYWTFVCQYEVHRACC